MTVIAEQFLDLSYSDEKVAVRLFCPQRQGESTWVCRFEIGAPISVALDIEGTSSLQALALALKGLSATLYSTELYRNRQLGAWGEFNGYLGIPAPGIFADIAPETF
jgi:hypothetical protein